MSERDTINWKQLFIGAVITFIVGTTSGILIFNYQTQEPRLYYSAPETIPFSGEDQVIGIYHISLSNEGKKASKNVICVIQIPEATIEDWKISTELLLAMELSSSVINDTLKLEFPLINPSERIHVSILATAANSLPLRPIVAIRAEDIVGIEKDLAEPFDVSMLMSTIGIVIGFVGVIFAFIMRLYRWQKERY